MIVAIWIILVTGHHEQTGSQVGVQGEKKDLVYDCITFPFLKNKSGTNLQEALFHVFSFGIQFTRGMPSMSSHYRCVATSIRDRSTM